MNVSYIDNPQKDYEKLLELQGIIDEFQEKRPNPVIKDYKEIVQEIIKDFIAEISKMGLDIRNLPLGHDLGHMVYDTKSALLLLDDKKITEKVPIIDLMIGAFGGVSHEIGLLLAYYLEFCQKEFDFTAVKRYEEHTRLLRHAEMSAILVQKAFERMNFSKFGMDSETENYFKKMSFYEDSAHTNYLKPSPVGEYIFQPYRDHWNDEKPIWPVLLTRFCDRMDCVSPHYILRHFTILYDEGEEQQHLTSEGGVQKQSALSMRESMDLSNNKSMKDHVMMFHDSQNNGTIYGKNDLPGVMQNYRRYLKDKHIITIAMLFCDYVEPLNRDEFKELIKNASMCAREDQINTLLDKFFDLPASMTTPWLRAFAKAKELMNELTFPGEKQAMENAKKLLGV